MSSLHVIWEIVQSYTLLLAPSESGTDWQSSQLKPCEVTSKHTDERGREEQEERERDQKEREREREREREWDEPKSRGWWRSVLTTTCRVLFWLRRGRAKISNAPVSIRSSAFRLWFCYLINEIMYFLNDMVYRKMIHKSICLFEIFDPLMYFN